MSDIKVVAYEKDIQSITDTIKLRTGSQEELSFPDGIITEISNIVDTLELYLDNRLISYVDCDQVISTTLFPEYPALKILYFPKAIEIASSVFYNCIGLETVVAPLTRIIGDGAFEYCSNLSEVDLPMLEELGNYSFEHCVSLTSISLPSATKLLDDVFWGCTCLETVDLGSATYLGYHTFYQCSNLKSVIIRQNEAICALNDHSAFYDTPIFRGEGYIYVPNELVNDYKAATNWAVFADQIKPLSEYISE